jgi:hypothetical protein
MINDCCRIELDARGGIVDYETTERTARYWDPENRSGACA